MKNTLHMMEHVHDNEKVQSDGKDQLGSCSASDELSRKTFILNEPTRARTGTLNMRYIPALCCGKFKSPLSALFTHYNLHFAAAVAVIHSTRHYPTRIHMITSNQIKQYISHNFFPFIVLVQRREFVPRPSRRVHAPSSRSTTLVSHSTSTPTSV